MSREAWGGLLLTSEGQDEKVIVQEGLGGSPIDLIRYIDLE